MTTTPPIVDEAEGFLRDLSTELARPHDNECLCCYLVRMLNQFSCDGTHRHAFRFRDSRAPRATGLKTRLRQLGACCCDCELFLNGYEPLSLSREYLGDDLDDEHQNDAVFLLPPCRGVRRGSVQPCGNWVRIRRR